MIEKLVVTLAVKEIMVEKGLWDDSLYTVNLPLPEELPRLQGLQYRWVWQDELEKHPKMFQGEWKNECD